MKEPRAAEIIMSELQALSQLMTQTKALLVQHPDNKLMALALRQDEYRHRQLLNELHLSLNLYLYHAE